MMQTTLKRPVTQAAAFRKVHIERPEIFIPMPQAKSKLASFFKFLLALSYLFSLWALSLIFE